MRALLCALVASLAARAAQGASDASVALLDDRVAPEARDRLVPQEPSTDAGAAATPLPEARVLKDWLSGPAPSSTTVTTSSAARPPQVAGTGHAGGSSQQGAASEATSVSQASVRELMARIPSASGAKPEQLFSDSAANVFAMDPLKGLEELVILVLLCVLIVLAWKGRKQLLILLTGDGEVHLTMRGSLWWGIGQCFGCCNHEWTRCLTSLPCCPRRFQGANLAQSVGAQFGLAPHAVELSNIVVGDLPYLDMSGNHGRGDFYITVESPANPPQSTSLAMQRLAKVVHFPEVLTLKIRSSSAQGEMVKIRVNELNVLGHQEICSLSLPAGNIFKWAKRSNGGLMRFAMKPSKDDEWEADTPPWIALEFAASREARNLDTLGVGADEVRTAIYDRDTNTTTFTPKTISEFKEGYKLVNNRGVRVQELMEEDRLQQLQRYEACCNTFANLTNILALVATIGYLVLRSWSGTCWKQFSRIAVASLSEDEVSWPLSFARLRSIDEACHEELDGTGIQAGASPCRPTLSQVLDICDKLPEGQPRPSHYGITCVSELQAFGHSVDVCGVHVWMETWDIMVIALCVLLLLVSCVCVNLYASAKIEARRQWLIQHSMEGDMASFTGRDSNVQERGGSRGLRMCGIPWR